uniref:Uncharacterized protein n=1 Tax=Phytophthora fragariae TaxID=53985 RepID=A0A6A3EV01_9STRA|nr:hypothetical protein PF009_g12824 [Phytophthora fragariae]
MIRCTWVQTTGVGHRLNPEGGRRTKPHHSGTEECLSKRTDGEKDYGAATYAGQVEQGGSGQQRLSDLLRTANEGQAREACAQVVE